MLKPARVRRANRSDVEFQDRNLSALRESGTGILQIWNAMLWSRSARPGCFHDLDGRPERGFYIQSGGIEQDGVRGRF